MSAAVQAYPVDLQSVPQARLTNRFPLLYLIHKVEHRGTKITIEVVCVPCHHGSEKKATRPRRWVDGQITIPHGHTARRSDRSRMPHLKGC